jgi:hypothetical protein
MEPLQTLNNHTCTLVLGVCVYICLPMAERAPLPIFDHTPLDPRPSPLSTPRLAYQRKTSYTPPDEELARLTPSLPKVTATQPERGL